MIGDLPVGEALGLALLVPSEGNRAPTLRDSVADRTVPLRRHDLL
jgi:hypothetical protein